MRLVELQQRAEGGGFPTSNEDKVFQHGEVVLVVSKQELSDLLSTTYSLLAEMLPGLKHIVFGQFKELNDTMLEISRTQHTLNK